MKSITLFFCLHIVAIYMSQTVYFISPTGNDKNSGSKILPFKTINYAIEKACREKGNININIMKGTYYLDETIQINSAIFSPTSLKINAYQNEEVFVSAGKSINCNWQPYKNGIYKTQVPFNLTFERLYINNKLQVLARYPNYDTAANVFNGTSADAIDKQRVKKWKKPVGGYIHALHEYEWGGFHYRIMGVDANGKLNLEGGWQNNRPSKMHETYRFVENIFEELDAPGEWWLDKKISTLYYYPPKEISLNDAKVEVSNFKNSIELHGTEKKPIKNITLEGIHFVHNERSFWDTKEPILRTDWTIYRGGAVLFDGTEDCKIINCSFTDIGGNAIMISNYNKGSVITECYIADIGASAVCFIGSTDAVRSPSFGYENHVPYHKIDQTPGPRTSNYPMQCTVKNNLFHDVGKIEKQATGVEIDIASDITVSQNTIYNTPRAGINVGDGCFGGHTIEYNDVFKTVLETGDHGAFNSWGRDRFWAPNRTYMDSLTAAHPELILLDAQKEITIRNNRFRCENGWDIDLDDGSSNYLIYNNVCLNGGLKLREGFHRTVKNNIIINNTFHPHVWFANSNDIFTNNIVMTAYEPIGMKYWGSHVDSNLFPNIAALSAAKGRGTDKNSKLGNPLFIDPDIGNYTVTSESPAHLIGFNNFSMDSFGVQKPSLKRIAEKPKFDTLLNQSAKSEENRILDFMDASLKSVEGLGDRSAYGLQDETGVIILTINKKSQLKAAGFQHNDVIRTVDGQKVNNTEDFLRIFNKSKPKGKSQIQVIRNQQLINLKLSSK